MDDTSEGTLPESVQQPKDSMANSDAQAKSGPNISGDGCIHTNVTETNFDQGNKETQGGSSSNSGLNNSEPISDSGRANAPRKHGRQSYASLFKNNRIPVDGSLLHYIAPPVGKVVLNADEIDSVEDTFGFCLVGYVMGTRPSAYAMLNFIKGWGDNIRFFYKENGWIQFQFANDSDRERVLHAGPYIILGRQLLLKKMPDCFMFSKEEMEFIPAWVQISGLPNIKQDLLGCWKTNSYGYANFIKKRSQLC